MTQPFVAQIRARGDAIQIAEPGAPAITVRVQMAEQWDTVKAIISPTDTIMALKEQALEALLGTGEPHSDFVLKLRGFEVLDEYATLAEAGAKDGSCFLITYRRRRAVR